jgi:hypothetical protein
MKIHRDVITLGEFAWNERAQNVHAATKAVQQARLAAAIPPEKLCHHPKYSTLLTALYVTTQSHARGTTDTSPAAATASARDFVMVPNAMLSGAGQHRWQRVRSN